MGIQNIIEDKRRWRAHMARVKALPSDYQVVYKELQKYLFKVGPVDLWGDSGVLVGIVELFEDGAAAGKGVLEVTGPDVAEFCDELIKDSPTWADVHQPAVDEQVAEAMKKSIDTSVKRSAGKAAKPARSEGHHD